MLRSLLYWPIFFLFALYASATNSFGWTEAGFNFRATSGYVTDGANETYVIGDSFPTTRGGYTFGWTSALSDAPRDRDSAVDRRLAGVHRIANGSPREFKVTLPSTGDWTICVALGDALFASTSSYLEFYDDTSTLFAINDTNGITGGRFDDAYGTEHTAGDWPTANVCRTVTFATTSFYMQVGGNSGTGDTYIAHLKIYSGGGTTTTTTTTLPSDYGCGVDTNRDASVSNWCALPDEDFDAVPVSGYTGPYGSDVDCDDADFFMFTGQATTSGCSPGQYKTCQSSGSYTSCSNTSAFTCHTGSGSTYWIGPSGGTSAAGTYADPWNWFCFSDSSLACYHAPVAGDCFVFKSGSYSGSWSDGGTTRQIFVNNKDGTNSNRVTLRNEPGTRPHLNGAGTAPTEVQIVNINDSDYVTVRGFEVDGTGDYSNAGIRFGAGIAPLVFDNYVHHIDGISGNNLAGIKFQGGTVGASAHHNLLVDNFETADPTAQNSGGITIMDDSGANSLWANVVVNTTTAGYGVRIKHPHDSGAPSIKYNFVRGVRYHALQTSNRDSVVNNNWVQDCTFMAIKYGDEGDNDAWYRDATFNYNTVQRCGFLDAKPRWNETTHTAYDGTKVFTADHNVMEDNTTGYSTDAADGVARMCDTNCTSGEFAAAIGKVTFSSNVYWSTGTSTLRFSYFGSGGGGAYYSSLSAWQTAGFDSGSVQSNPLLDADGISATYPNHGWRANMFTNVSGTTTTTTTTTTTSTTTTTTLPPTSYNSNFMPYY